MEHPFINGLNDLTDEELQNRVNELTNKFFVAQKSGNAQLCHQIQMAIESYRNKLQERYRKGDDNSHDEKINIS